MTNKNKQTKHKIKSRKIWLSAGIFGSLPGDLALCRDIWLIAGRFGSLPGYLAISPGDLALSPGYLARCRKIWLSAGIFGSLPGDMALSPGDLALCREIWLSPVIQATWEARAVDGIKVERSQQGN
jgi:hypothetical protein